MKWSFLKYCVLLLFFMDAVVESQVKTKRVIIPTYKKNGHNFWTFFVALKNLVGDQYVDTRNTINQVNDIVRDTFSDTATTTTPNPFAPVDNSTSTTTEKYRVSRYEFGRILGRNFRGLQKIFQDDLQVALNQSNTNIEEYKKELQNAIGTPAPKKRGKTNGSQKKRRKITTSAPASIIHL
ncbi:uncharacterized protein LOC129613152 [Condylostylus longicornis]|uniref:uncharacterized protein LOC129613152 n=1 Tax=Condylostylus longicornis TaxID=2530218 RepID=UPI00244E3EE4|nr:uncharacterized protein LOC129613152 [Condylostylus longicornis]